jgi:hypothetical protein
MFMLVDQCRNQLHEIDIHKECETKAQKLSFEEQCLAAHAFISEQRSKMEFNYYRSSPPIGKR